jgi:hypothetical protein
MTDQLSESAPGREHGTFEITLSSANVWRAGLVLLGVVTFGLVLRFVLNDGGSGNVTGLMSWVVAIAMAEQWAVPKSFPAT